MEIVNTEAPETPVREHSKWLVTSALLHGFGIALAALMTVVIEIPSDDKPLVLMTSITRQDDQAHPILSTTPISTERLVTKDLIEPLDAAVLTNVAAEQLRELVRENEATLDTVEDPNATPDDRIQNQRFDSGRRAISDSTTAWRMWRI